MDSLLPTGPKPTRPAFRFAIVLRYLSIFLGVLTVALLAFYITFESRELDRQRHLLMLRAADDLGVPPARPTKARVAALDVPEGVAKPDATNKVQGAALPKADKDLPSDRRKNVERRSIVTNKIEDKQEPILPKTLAQS